MHSSTCRRCQKSPPRHRCPDRALLRPRPTVIVEIAPRGCKAEAVIVLVHARLSRAVLEKAAPILVQLVAEQEIGRTILGIVIRSCVCVLSFALEIHVTAQIEVKIAVSI